MRARHLTVTLLLGIACAAQAKGSPIQWPVASGGNGHYYEALAFTPGTNWFDAKTAAEQSTYLGNSGYLATVASQAENDFLQALMSGVLVDGFIGGFQPADSPEPAGNWQWVTGEAWSDINWRSGEPNNDNNNENVLKIFASSGQWNDVPDSNYVDGYIIEYAPEPATLALLALGGLALLRKRRS